MLKNKKYIRKMVLEKLKEAALRTETAMLQKQIENLKEYKFNTNFNIALLLCASILQFLLIVALILIK